MTTKRRATHAELAEAHRQELNKMNDHEYAGALAALKREGLPTPPSTADYDLDKDMAVCEAREKRFQERRRRLAAYDAPPSTADDEKALAKWRALSDEQQVAFFDSQLQDDAPPLTAQPTQWRVTGDGYIARAEGGYVPLRTPFRADAFTGPEGAENRSDTTDAELDANAAFIVKAVNSHDALVAALNSCLEWMEFTIPRLKGSCPHCKETVDAGGLNWGGPISKARAALSAVEGEE